MATVASRHPEIAAQLVGLAAPLRVAAAKVLDASDFVREALAADPALLPRLADINSAPLPAPVFTDEPEFMAALRRWRRAELARLAWRDLAGWANVTETLLALSQVADEAIRSAQAAAVQVLNARHGSPRATDGSLQELVVLAMGKLGGDELNFSSDVDLIFLFPEHGETDGARPLSNEEYFTRLGQLLIRYLDQQTVDGFVCRVDMRLRPFGDSGPLVASFASLEDYLERQGRDWERYAWVKARAVTGMAQYAGLFSNVVRPFVYRRYLDYGVFESLREMKALIEREVVRRELQDNIKLGPGGIREVEFIVQSLQLVRGGSDTRLQGSSLLQVLPQLAGSRLLPTTVALELGAAYKFLRRLENCLQMRADQQTHSLPTEPAGREQLAGAMGLRSWAELLQQLTAQRRCVSAHFAAVVFNGNDPGDGEPRRATPAQLTLAQLWHPDTTLASLAAALRELGCEDSEGIAQLLIELRGSALLRRLDEPGRQRLHSLLPELLADAMAAGPPLPIMRRVLRLIDAIGQRSAYFSLLREQPTARARLVELAAHGDFLINQLAAHPLLLDELIDARLVEEVPERAALQLELTQRMALAADDDDERQVEQLRHFQRAAVFRIAVADLTGRLPVMRVSDRLTDVAELIIEQALQLTWRQVTAQLGTPMCGSGAERRSVNICAVGYGKLGGMELGYASDLDLVFLHDSRGESQETTGARTLDNQVFFVRFVQRLVHLLSMHSAAGRLYEVDMRLRPSGKGGMLITNIGAFAEYQQREAWTWEHQALLHARAVAGAVGLRAQFENLRTEVLQAHVRRATLQADVRQMRERMRAELASPDPLKFDIKQGAGGIADIEFLAQYWALRWASEYPPVAMYSDTIRQLESVASADLVPQSSIDVLTGAYRRYRERLHHRSLEEGDAVVAATELVAERSAVSSIWQQTMQV